MARVLAGLEKEDEGYVFFDGQPLTPGERSEQTSLVLQDADYQLYRESVQEELKLGFKGQETPADRIQEIAEKLGLEDFLDRHPQSLSGGQKQRLTIGMAEVKDSPLVILDEPTSGLDVRSMQRICELVKSWAKSGRICVLISHDFEFLLETCTRVVAIDNGANIRDFPLERGRSLELLAILRGLASDSATKYRNIELHTRFRADRSQHEVLHNRRRRPMRYLEGDPIFVHLSKK